MLPPGHPLLEAAGQGASFDGDAFHWWTPLDTSDPFTAGAVAALSTSLSLIYGDEIGNLLTGLTLEAVQVWNGTDNWVDWA